MQVREDEQQCDVVFITMPFALRAHPALGLSLLQASLKRSGIANTTLYLNLGFAEELGWQFYDDVCDMRQTDLIGEWIFSNALLAHSAAQIAQFSEHSLKARGQSIADKVFQAGALAVGYVARAAERVLAHKPRVVGFTSTFEQHAASLALAKHLKAARPDIVILFGGANCEGPMGAELIRQFPFVDAVVSGEGDSIIADLVRSALGGAPHDDLPGVYTQRNIARVTEQGYPTAPSVTDMDALPYPDFSDFFKQTAALRANTDFKARLLFETSRGCWWGQKHHCTFCGLNGTTMAFRSKSAARAIDELQWLVETYETRSIGAVDNILDMKYFLDFVPELIRRNLDLDITYEVKANLKKEHLRALRAAGIRTLQPGIESLSTSILKLMDKGVRGLQNVQLLKWCQELGIFVAWNILWGFPGESAAEYARMAELVPLLTHLRPPIGSGPIRLDRFSPNYDTAREKGLVNLRPYPTYGFVYGMDDAALENFAYYFDYDYADSRDVTLYTAALEREVKEWKAIHATSELLSLDFDDTLLIVDARPKCAKSVEVLTGIDRLLYQHCDAIASIAQLQKLAGENGTALARAEIEDRLARLLELGLMLREGDAYLALAIPLGEYAPNAEIGARINTLLALFEPSAA